MRQFLALAIGLAIASSTFGTAGAQQQRGQDHNRGDQGKGHGGNPNPVKPTRRPPAQRPTTPSRPTQPQRRGPATQPRPVRTSQQYRGHWPTQNNPRRPGQTSLPNNHYWRPTRNHQFNSRQVIGLNIWAASSFTYGGQIRQWNPDMWRYSLESPLVELVFRSERLSNAMRASFERQLSRGNLRESRGAQNAWNRVQRMDESLEKLRYEAGDSSDSEMRESVNDALALAQQVANSFARHPELQALVRYEWDDLRFELNEMARYYGELPLR